MRKQQERRGEINVDKRVEVFIREIYEKSELPLPTIDCSVNRHVDVVQSKIEKVSDYLGLKTHYIPYPSELNNLDGRWRFFLNQLRNPFNLWQEFGRLVGIYYEEVLNSGINNHSKVTVEELIKTDHFAYFFCVPNYLLDNMDIPPDQNKAIKIISNTFTVDNNFAANKLSLYRASK